MDEHPRLAFRLVPAAGAAMSALNPDTRVYIAGHRGLVGSALLRRMQAAGHRNFVLRTHAELDLVDGAATREFFEAERPELVFLAAAKVGGILANNSYPAEFIHDNLAVQTNVIHSAWRSGVKRLLFLGSSCIYPKLAPQPMKERDLLSGPLEPTNRPYALAKIAGIEMCWSYNRQYGTQYLSVMPTNLYGPGDNFHPTHSHVIPALLRKFHEAKARGDASVTVWGSGTPRREFLYSDDMADACVFLMNLPDERYRALLGSDESVSGRFEPPVVNIGYGEDVTIAELAALVARTVGFGGRIEYDSSKPDGTPRKLMDVSLLSAAGWKASTRLDDGLREAYRAFVAAEAAGVSAG
jgi:GDP-L-fucose synthase